MIFKSRVRKTVVEARTTISLNVLKSYLNTVLNRRDQDLSSSLHLMKKKTKKKRSNHEYAFVYREWAIYPAATPEKWSA